MQLTLAWGVIDRANDEFREIEPTVGSYKAFIRKRDKESGLISEEALESRVCTDEEISL